MRIGLLNFVDVRSARDVQPGDLVIHESWGVGEVIGHRSNSVLVRMFDLAVDDDGKPFSVPDADVLELTPSELGFVRCKG